MVTFIKKHRFIIIQVTLLAIFLIAASIILYNNGLLVGRLESDFKVQHIRFIDYLRENFFATKDLFPQLDLNHGGSANFSSMYYYGMYNPFIMASYLFPWISTDVWMQIIYIIIILLTYVAMNFFLQKHNVSQKNVIIFSLLTACSPPLLYHFGFHIMFVYYYPIFIFSLIAIYNLVERGVKYQLIICIALILFTNFFFSIVIGVLQVAYFICLLFFEKKADKEKIISSIRKIIICYIVGILIGMLPLLPQISQLTSNIRDGKNVKISFFINNFFGILVTSKQGFGLGLFSFFALFSTIFNRKNKFILMLSIILGILMVSGHINYALNVFQYIHLKIFIYFIPLIYLICAINLDQNKLKPNVISILTSLLIVLVLTILGKTVYDLNRGDTKIIEIILVMQVVLMLIIVMMSNRIGAVLSIVVSIVLCITWSTSSLKIIGFKEYKDEILNYDKKAKDYKLKGKKGYYRELHGLNTVSAINNYNPLMYTSIENKYYIDFLTNCLPLEKSIFNRMVKSQAIDNAILRKFFGINLVYGNPRNENVKPFIHGVENDDVYNIDDLNKLDKDNRLFALNNGIFTSNSKKKFKLSRINAQKIFDLKNKKKLNFIIPIDAKYKDGIFIIKVDTKKPLSKAEKIYVNNHEAVLRKKNFYGEKAVNKINFILDAKGKNLKVTNESKKKADKNITVYYYSNKDIYANNYSWVNPSDEKVINNRGYKFDMNMKKDGYLNTTIFYDDAYKVIIDGKEVSKELVNGHFLGAKIEKGNHNIEIVYEMPGFKVGLILSVLGLFILGFIMIDEIKFLNRSFFRFVLIGVFNTINYFVMYQILLVTIPYTIAHIIAFVYSGLVSYFITTVYTFKSKPTLKTFIAFPLTYLPNLIMSTFGTMMLVELNIINQSYASLVMMLAAIPITFLVNKLIFTSKKRESVSRVNIVE